MVAAKGFFFIFIWLAFGSSASLVEQWILIFLSVKLSCLESPCHTFRTKRFNSLLSFVLFLEIYCGESGRKSWECLRIQNSLAESICLSFFLYLEKFPHGKSKILVISLSIYFLFRAGSFLWLQTLASCWWPSYSLPSLELHQLLFVNSREVAYYCSVMCKCSHDTVFTNWG